MEDGLYFARFSTAQDAGAGVAYKNGERVWGGDSGYAWRGRVIENAGALRVTLSVRRHNDTFVGVFGPLDDFELNLEGKNQSGGIITLVGSTPNAPGVAITVRLRSSGF